MGITFRPAHLDDLEAQQLLRDYEADLRGQGVVLDKQHAGAVHTEEFLPPQGLFLIADLDGSPVGCGRVRRLAKTRVAEIKMMYVAPSARGRGVGAALLARLEREAHTLGCEVARLDTGAGMAAALSLYAKAGYVEIADYNGDPSAAYWMEKPL